MHASLEWVLNGCALHWQVTKRRNKKSTNITFSVNPQKCISTKISESTVYVYYTMVNYAWFSFKQNGGFSEEDILKFCYWLLFIFFKWSKCCYWYMYPVYFRESLNYAHRKQMSSLFVWLLYDSLIPLHISYLWFFRLLRLQEWNTCFLSIQIQVKITWTRRDNFVWSRLDKCWKWL